MENLQITDNSYIITSNGACPLRLASKQVIISVSAFKTAFILYLQK